MWNKEIIKTVEEKLSAKIVLNESTKQMYEFLFLNKEKNFEDFYFLILPYTNKSSYKDIINFLLEIIDGSFYIEVENNFILFYKGNLDIELNQLILSLSEDFSVSIRIFSSGKVSFHDNFGFIGIYQAYKLYLNKSNNYYCSNKDLIMELYNKDKQMLSKLKPVILNKVLVDHQLENLVYAFVKNNLNITKTAKDTYMHRNTINNKLDLITKETGLNIRQFYDAMALLLLLSL